MFANKFAICQKLKEFGNEQNEQERPAGNKKCKLFGY